MTLRTSIGTSAKPHAATVNAVLHHLSTSARSPHVGAASPTLTTTNKASLKIGNEGKAMAKKLGEGGCKKADAHLGHRMATTQNSGHLRHLGRRSASVRHATGDGGWTKLD